MKSKVFQNIAAWIQERREARQDRRHRRALIQEDRREKRELRRLCRRLAETPPKISEKRPEVSSLLYNISVKPPKISKSAAEQIGLGRKFELVEARRERTATGAVVYLTLHWKSKRKPRYIFQFDIVDPAELPPLSARYAESAAWPLQRDPWPGIIPLKKPAKIDQERLDLLKRIQEETPEERKRREELINIIFEDVEAQMRAAGKRLEYGPFLTTPKPTK